MIEIIIALIGAVATVVTTLITNKKTNAKVDKYDSKNAIIMMIMEDHILHGEGKLPVNYQNVLHEFDIYKENHGNSYIGKKVNDYCEWYEKVEKGFSSKKAS